MGGADGVEDPRPTGALGRHDLGGAPGLRGEDIRPGRPHDHDGGDGGRRGAEFPRQGKPRNDGAILVAGDPEAAEVGEGGDLARRRLALQALGLDHPCRACRRKSEVGGIHRQIGEVAFVGEVTQQRRVIEIIAGDAVDVDEAGHAARPQGGEGLDVERAVGVADEDHRPGLAHTVQQASQLVGDGGDAPVAGARGRGPHPAAIIGADAAALGEVGEDEFPVGRGSKGAGFENDGG